MVVAHLPVAELGHEVDADRDQPVLAAVAEDEEQGLGLSGEGHHVTRGAVGRLAQYVLDHRYVSHLRHFRRPPPLATGAHWRTRPTTQPSSGRPESGICCCSWLLLVTGRWPEVFGGQCESTQCSGEGGKWQRQKRKHPCGHRGVPEALSRRRHGGCGRTLRGRDRFLHSGCRARAVDRAPSTRAEFADFLALMGKELDGRSFTANHVLCDGAEAVLVARITSVAGATGRPFETAFAPHLTVADGQITRYRLYDDTYAAALAFTA
ncbi:nuclear transport factor 2 family protein [Streptomyces sp. NPDC058623]|uniref:nuclear transport factor 2 family protein n=1 Tax=Streptomyces sp. NPDC058623 TaxID=3346563 RepID=UPI0036476F6B